MQSIGFYPQGVYTKELFVLALNLDLMIFNDFFDVKNVILMNFRWIFNEFARIFNECSMDF